MRKEGRDAALLCTPSVPWLVYHRVQYPPRTCQGEPWSAPPSALSAWPQISPDAVSTISRKVEVKTRN